LGFGLPSCVEKPENVCDASGRCNEGCGNVSTSTGSAFVCLSKDDDDDGVPNYLDPDKDGDGIANEDDLDSDGDGVDDPKYPNQGSIVVVNTRKLEGLTSDLISELEKQNDSGQMPAFSTSLGEGIAEQTALSRLQNSPVLNALSGMSGFISFGAGAACPNFSFYLPSPIDKNVGTTIHCDLMPTIGIVITPVMLAIYLWMGFRVFASA
jgi:hypothetical protein